MGNMSEKWGMGSKKWEIGSENWEIGSEKWGIWTEKEMVKVNFIVNPRNIISDPG